MAKTKSVNAPKAGRSKSETTYELSNGFGWKSETTKGDPLKWWKDFEKRFLEGKTEKKESLATYVLWQASAIAQTALELADHIEVVGNKPSTINKIDSLRMEINYLTKQIGDRQHEQQAKELYDLLKTILVGRHVGKGSDKDTDGGILAYYKCTKAIPDPKKDVEKLRRVAQALQNLAGDFKDHCPLETMTAELRVLAGDLRHYSFMDAETAGRAEMLNCLFSAVVSGFCGVKKPLTEDEARAKSYLGQVHAILHNISEIGRSRRFQQPPEKLQEYADQLEHFAKQLDECPPVAQHAQFWEKLRQVDLAAQDRTETPGAADGGKIKRNPDEIKAKKEPVSKIAGLILEKLKSLPEHEAMNTAELLSWLSREHKKDIDDSTLRRYLKKLKPYGLQNKPKIGYFLS